MNTIPAVKPAVHEGTTQDRRQLTTVSVVLPALNEELNLRHLLPRLRKELDRIQGFGFEILVVNDGSSDATAVLAAEFGARVVHHPEPMGNGAAVKKGIREARGEWILLMDADGQHPPQEIGRLLAQAEHYDMVVAARIGGGAWHRNLANRIYNGLASYVTGRRIEDLTSGFRLVRAEPLRSFLYLLPNTFSYPTTITMAMIRAGYPVRYIPFVPNQREGSSKIRLLRDGSRFFMIILKVATLFSPLKVFMPMAAAVWAIGITWYLVTYLTDHRFTNMALLALVQGSILFFLGLISEQVAQLRYDRSTNGPDRR